MAFFSGTVDFFEKLKRIKVVADIICHQMRPISEFLSKKLRTWSHLMEYNKDNKFGSLHLKKTKLIVTEINTLL
jgi:hypothetical protein